MNSRLAALILAGGTSRRMAGVDKCAIEVDGTPLVDRVLAAVRPWVGMEPNHIVLVGPPRSTGVSTRRTREEPPGSGPLAAIAAGLGVLSSPVSTSEPDSGPDWGPDSGPAPGPTRVLLLAGDIPFPGPGLEVLLAEPFAPEIDVVLGRDQRGRDQFLFACWRTDSLRKAVARHRGSDPVRLLYDQVRIEHRDLPTISTIDCDTAADLERARQLARRCPDPLAAPNP